MKGANLHGVSELYRAAIMTLLLLTGSDLLAQVQPQSVTDHTVAFLKDADLSVSYSATIEPPNPGSDQPVHSVANFASGVMARYEKSFHRWWLNADLNYGYSNINQRYNEDAGGYSGIKSNLQEWSITDVLKGPKLWHRIGTFAEIGAGALIFNPINGEVDMVEHITHGANGKKLATPYDITIRNFGTTGQTKASAVFGAGLSMDLSKHFAARAEYRGFEYLSPTYNAFTTFNSQEAKYTQQPTLGMILKF